MTDSRKGLETPPEPLSFDADAKVDPRARPVILAAQALKILHEHVPGTSAVPVMPKLRWCMDGLLLLQSELPPAALPLFDKLDTKVQVLSIQLGENPRALDDVREALIERVIQLGDVLMEALMRPETTKVPLLTPGSEEGKEVEDGSGE